MRALPKCMFLSPHDFCACSFQTCVQTTCKAPDLVIQVQTGCPCMSHALQVHNPKSKANLHCNPFRLQCGSLHTFSTDHPRSYVHMLCILPLRAMQTFPQPAAEQKHFSHSAGNRFNHFHKNPSDSTCELTPDPGRLPRGQRRGEYRGLRLRSQVGDCGTGAWENGAIGDNLHGVILDSVL